MLYRGRGGGERMTCNSGKSRLILMNVLFSFLKIIKDQAVYFSTMPCTVFTKIIWKQAGSYRERLERCID